MDNISKSGGDPGSPALDSSPALKLTRRGVLALAASAVAAEALAANERVEVTFDDNTRRRVRIAALGKEAILDASFLDASPEGHAHFRIVREPGSIRIELQGGSMHPGATLAFSLVISAPSTQPPGYEPAPHDASVFLEVGLGVPALLPDGVNLWGDHGDVRLPRLAGIEGGVNPAAKGLGAWLEDLTLAHPLLDKETTRRLIRRLFGERTAVQRAELRFSLVRAAGQRHSVPVWSLKAPDSAPLVLWRSGIEYSELRFGRGNPWVGSAEVGAGAPRPISAMFPFHPQRVGGTTPQETALYGFAANARRVTEFAAADLGPGSALSAATLPLPSAATTHAAVSVAFRTLYGARTTVSAVFGTMDLHIRGDATAPAGEGPFRSERTLVHRGEDLSAQHPGRVVTRLMVHPPAREWEFRTRQGILVASGPDASPQQAAEAGRSAPVVMEWIETGPGRRPLGLSGRLSIRQLCVPLEPEAAGGAAPQAGQSVPWSRLDFPAGTPCMFTFEEPSTQAGPSEAAVLLGRRAAGGAPAWRVPLDGAVLRCVRPGDLLSLTWRFREMVLERSRGRTSIVSNRRLVQNAAAQRADRAPVPLMSVEFPPQHLAELAYLRQRDTRDPPDVALDDPAKAQQLAGWLRSMREGAAPERLKARRDLRAALAAYAAMPPEDGKPPRNAVFNAFCDEFHRRAAPRFGEELATYVGRYAVDPDVMAIARDVAREVHRRQDPVPLLAGLPAAPPAGAGGTADRPSPDADFEAFRSWYAQQAGAALKARWPEYPGREAALTGLRAPADASQADKDVARALAQELLGVLEAFDRRLTEQAEPFRDLTPAASAGPSRLVFRVEGSRARYPDLPPGGMPFRLSALTNWASFDLSVVRRAEVLFEDGGQDRFSRRPSRDEAAILEFQGLSRGVRSGDAIIARNHWRRRLSEIADAARERPGAFETDIELPARLHLSPGQDALFHTPRPLPGGLNGEWPASPLWDASLVPGSGRSPLRAVWSPDFVPNSLADRVEQPAPERGPRAPWASYPGQVQEGGAGAAAFRLPLDARDRQELVGLTSLHGLPVRASRKRGELVGDSQFEIPPGFELAGLMPPAEDDPRPNAIYRPAPLGARRLSLTALGGTANLETTFQPPTASRTLRPGRTGGRPEDEDTPFGFAIQKWSQTTVLGRDVEVEVQYRGFLYPLGVRAVLVKRTERTIVRRTIVDGGRERSGPPVAYLVQRQFLRVVEKSKPFPAADQPNGARRWPVGEILMLTDDTPDIVDPASDAPPELTTPEAADAAVAPRGRIPLPAGAEGFAFWPRTAARPGADVRFEMMLDQADPVTMPLIFVDNIAANHQASLAAVTDYYRALGLRPGGGDPRVRMDHGGAVRPLAPPSTAGDTSLLNLSWTLGGEGRRSLVPRPDRAEDPNANFDFASNLQGVDQPPFYPFVRELECVLDKVQSMTGVAQAPVRARFNATYWRNSFDGGVTADETAQRAIFLELLDKRPLQLGASGKGDRLGGVAQPTLEVIGVSRQIGPVARSGHVPHPPDGTGPLKGIEFPAKLDPNNFFDTNAKLLGAFDLKDVISAAGSAASPELKEAIAYGSAKLAALQQDAEAAAGAALEALRREVLVPMRAALDRAEVEAVSKPGAQGGLLASLQTGFPELAQAWTALRGALDRAIEAAAPGGGIVSAARELSEVHAAAKRLLAGLEQMARDPVSYVRSLADRLVRLGRDRLLARTDDLEDLLRNGAASLATSFPEGTLGFLLFLPRPDLPETLLAEYRHRGLGAVRSAAAQFIAECLAGAPDNVKAALAELIRTDPADPSFRAAAAKLRTALADRLAAELDEQAESAAQSVSDALKEAAGDIRGNPEAIEGPLLLGFLLAVGFALVAFPDAATTEVRRQVEGLADRLRTKALEEARARVGAQLPSGDPCRWIGLRLADLLKTLLPAGIVAACTGGPTVGGSQPEEGTPGRLCAALFELQLRIDAFAQSDDGSLGEAITRLQADIARKSDDVSKAARAYAQAVSALGANWEASLRSASCAAADIDGIRRSAESLPLFRIKAVVARQADLLAAAAAVPEILPRADARLRAALAAEASGAAVSALRPALDGAVRLAANLTAAFVTADDVRTQALDAIAGVVGTAATLKDEALALRAAARCELARIAAASAKQLLEGGGPIPGNGCSAEEAAKVLERLRDRLSARLQRAVLDALQATVGAAARLEGELALRLLPALSAAIDGLARAHGWAVIAREELRTVLQGAAEQIPDLADIRDLLEVPPVAGGKDQIDRDAESFAQALALSRPQAPGIPVTEEAAKATLVFATEQAARIREDRLGLQAFSLRTGELEAIGRRAVTSLLARAFDLQGLRREVDRLIGDLVPAKSRLAYDLDLPLKRHGSEGAILFEPKGGRLTLKSSVEVSLLQPGDPRMDVEGKIDPFEISIFGFVRFEFGGIRMTGRDGRTEFKVDFRGVKPLAKLGFLEALQNSLAPKGGSGPFVVPSADGIRAGYSLNLGIIQLGGVTFQNVALSAFCHLPFDQKAAEFGASIGSEEAPFIISAHPYAGGGFLELTSTGSQITSIRMALEFGGSDAFSFGPLEGKGRVMTGIYVAIRSDPKGKPLGNDVGGYFVAAGSARIACFGTAAVLSVRITQTGGGVEGSATFRYSFSLGFKDIDFDVPVSKVVPKLGSAALRAPGNQFAQLGGGATSMQATHPRGRLLGRNLALGPGRDLARYLRYTDATLLRSSR